MPGIPGVPGVPGVPGGVPGGITADFAAAISGMGGPGGVVPLPLDGVSNGNGGRGLVHHGELGVGLCQDNGNGSASAAAARSPSLSSPVASGSGSPSASSLGASVPGLGASFQGRMQSLSLGSEPQVGLPDRSNGIPIPGIPNNGGSMGDRINSVDNLLSSLPKSLSDVNLAEMGAKTGGAQAPPIKNGVSPGAGGAWINHVSG